DGSYLAEFLLAKGYEVHGILRRSSSFNTGRIEHLYQNPQTHTEGNMRLHYGDLTDSTCLVKIINEVKPTEIYNLGAQSHVKAVRFLYTNLVGEVVDFLGKENSEISVIGQRPELKGRSCRLHIERLWQRFHPNTFLLWDDSAVPAAHNQFLITGNDTAFLSLFPQLHSALNSEFNSEAKMLGFFPPIGRPASLGIYGAVGWPRLARTLSFCMIG
ncbi:hypothetical protein CRENBAI_003610, partial [Crenichthys baileyi]